MKKIILFLLCLLGIFNLTAQTTITIGSAGYVNGLQESSPINVYFRSHHCQFLYTPADINGAGWSTAGSISKLGFNIFGTTSEALPNFTIKFKNTASTNVANYDGSGLSTAYTSASYFPTAGGFELLTLDNNFIWDGTSNLLVDVCFDQISAYTSTGQLYMFGYTNSNPEYAYIRDDDNPQCGVATGGSTNYNYAYKPQIQLELTTLPLCSGSPLAGDAVATSTSVCANTSFDLNLINNGINSGLTYQWQSSPNGSTWTNLGSTQLTSLMNIPFLSSNTYYQCVTTCTASALSSTSTPVMVALNPLLNCYCMISVANNNNIDCTQDKFIDFSLANVNGQTTNCDAFGFSDSTASNYTSINLSAGGTYTFTANTSISGFNGDGYAGAWIDYNQNAIFDSNEFIYIGLGASGTYSNTFTVPITVNTGPTRIRIMLDAYYGYPGTVLSACSNTSPVGQILDYKVNLTAAPACSGNPNAGNATSTQSAVCQNVGYTLDLINNDAVSGISYQWQSSPNGTVWTNLGSAQNTIPYNISTQSATTHYRCVMTCTSAVMSGTSTAVVVNQNLATACYCVPENISCSSSQITNVTLESINHAPSCDPSGYLDYRGIAGTASLTASQSYSISLDLNCQGSPGYVGLWIDFDQNGTFDASEYTYVGTTSFGTITGTIAVPYSAVGGQTAMRIKMETTWGIFGGLDPCYSNEYSGQTFDYSINLTPAIPCSGSPNAGNATSTSTAVCEDVPFILNLVNNDLVSNISYQWQSSPDNVIWTNLGAAQMSVPYTITSQTVTMHYRCITTCTTSALSSTSTPVTVTQKLLTACYCTPPPSDCASGDEINEVTLATLTNTSSCSAYGYEDYAGSVASATIQAGQSYTMTTVLGADYSAHVTVWIDYNQNGVFDASEYTNLGATNSAGNFTVTNTVNIPSGALAGNTKMRVRNNYNGPFGPNDPCSSGGGGAKSAGSASSINGSGGYGETEDYAITILPPDCSTINYPPSYNVTGSLDICPTQSTSLDITPAVQTATGITYEWMYFNGSAYVSTGAPSATSQFTAAPSANTLYYCEVQCNGSQIRNSDTVNVKVNTITTAPVFTNATCNGLCNGNATINATSSGATLSYTWSPSVGTADMAVALCAGTYTVDIVNPTGCMVTETLTITSPAALMPNATSNNVSCFGGSNGSISLAPTGGTGAYTYSWTPNVGTTSTITNLTAGSYTCILTDANGCTTSGVTIISEPSVLAVTVTNVLGSCLGGSSGQAEMQVTGGTLPYIYSWTSGGSNALETGLAIGSQTCTITDANSCSITETVSINQAATNFSVSIQGNNNVCEQIQEQLSILTVGSGSGSYNYSWVQLPGTVVSTTSDYTYTTSIGTYTYDLTVTDVVTNCIANANTFSVQVNPSSNFSGTVTTSGSAPVAGRVVLFQYQPFYTKFDSVAGQNIGAAGDFLFTSFVSGIYIIKAIPTATNMQIAYGADPGDTAVAWKDAKQIIHGCAVNDVQNIFVPALLSLATGSTGLLSGRITEGYGYDSTQRMANGYKPLVPGTPIGGIIVKGGKNPGGQMFAQTVTDANGDYSLNGLPPNDAGESYFILVDIPGLDTNNTYHKVIISNDQFTGLDFVVDSAKITPVPTTGVGVHDITAIENDIKVFPNPASAYVTIQYSLKSSSSVKIELFDMIGRSVKMLLPETQQGIQAHKQSWQTNDLRSGLYFIKMTVNGSESIIKLSVTN
ncbi:MAG: GEVED domain-containing protein [Bacteroidota bacterium]